MKLAKRKAIRECKRMWLGKNGIKESGLSKFAFLDSPDGKKWEDKGYVNDCPLCEYCEKFRFDLTCTKCPLKAQYGKRCCELGFRDEISSPSFFEAVRGLKE